ncbi:MAG: LysR family transcriptional regulator [Aestuariibacter sp.]|nr:LysR family transcriptional regulator [Aestuariibacter sp.]
MIAGTVSGAAKALNVSAPGVSRVMKHAERLLGIRLFSRRQGRFTPTQEARHIFDQINEVYRKVEDLQFSIESLKRGDSTIYSFASVPSISLSIVPRAVKSLKQKFPNLIMHMDMLKIKEPIDFLLLKHGELVVISHKHDHPGIVYHHLVRGEHVAIVPVGHPLACKKAVTVAELVEFPIVGISHDDPYGHILARTFTENGFDYNPCIQARFSPNIISLVRHDLGVAVVDEFSVAAEDIPGIVRLTLIEETHLDVFAAVNEGIPESIFSEYLIRSLKTELSKAVRNRPWSL